jgi:hypothetical protein
LFAIRHALHVIVDALLSKHDVQYEEICIVVHASIDGRGGMTDIGGMNPDRSVFGVGHMIPASIDGWT